MPESPFALAPDWSSRDALLASRDEGVRSLVEHAGRAVPFYRELWADHGVSPEDVRGADDLTRLPIVDRDTIQRAPPERLLAEGTDRDALQRVLTSGSTGRPLAIHHSPEDLAKQDSIRARMAVSFGLKPFDVHASVGYIRPEERDRGAPTGIASRLFPTVKIDVIQSPEAILEELVACAPRVVSGYSGVLTRVASLCLERPIPPLDLRFLLVGGDVLTGPMRRRIVEGFDAPVRQTYASHEMGFAAWECPETGLLHVREDAVVVEVLADGRPAADGEDGEVVVTVLQGRAQPFVRYRLGDLVTRGPTPCPCGAPYATLREIHGRMIDHLVLPGGELQHPYLLASELVRHGDWLIHYRVVQEREDRVVVEMVPEDGKLHEEPLREMGGVLAGMLGPDVALELRLVDEIEPEPSGKFRMFRSRVASLYDLPAGDA